MSKLTLIWMTILLSMQICSAYKILVFFSMPGKSHRILGEGVVRNLLQAGHEITYVTPFPKGSKAETNLTEIDISSVLNLRPSSLLNLHRVMSRESDMSSITHGLNILISIQGASLGHEKVQKLFRDPAVRFDAIIAEWTFGDTYAALPALYDCPFIWFSSVDPHWMVLQLIDEIPNPAYSCDILSNSVVPFTFVQRIKELYTIIMTSIFQYLKISYMFDKIYQEHLVPIIKLKGRQVPDFKDLHYNASLMLGNSHISMGHSIRLPQNYINIGGYHIETNVKPLPEELQNLLNGAKNGLIYFSMGSNLKSKEMPNELKQRLLKMFGGLKQTVLWKFEEELPNRPSNVYIVKWAPQQSILAHPNCVLFITHGGLLSVAETIHFGKPIIGIPVYADQFNNIGRAMRRGFAIRVDLSYTMAAELKKAIQEILSNASYAEKAKEISYVYHDRPVPPGQELVHWVQHVVATRGAPHLRSPALFVPWYQKMYLDLALVVLAVIYALKIVLKRIGEQWKKM